MRDKKKLVKISLISVVVCTLGIVCGCLIWKMHALNKAQIKQETPAPTTEKTPNGPKPFFNEDAKIDFNSAEKAQIIQFNVKNNYIKTNVFKYFFITEFNKLGPNSEKLTLRFNFDDVEAKKIKVEYLYGKFLENTFNWYFVLK